MVEGEVTGIASFNQAGYSQIRIHELFSRIDRLSINPLFMNQDFGSYNYEIIFRDLCSVFTTISSKLHETELEEVLKLRNEIKTLIKSNPAFIMQGVRDLYGNKKQSMKFNNGDWEIINDKLFFLRLKLEKQMDKHGFGNPSKKDINTSVIN